MNNSTKMARHVAGHHSLVWLISFVIVLAFHVSVAGAASAAVSQNLTGGGI